MSRTRTLPRIPLDPLGRPAADWTAAAWRERAAHAIRLVAQGHGLADLPLTQYELYAALKADAELQAAYEDAKEMRADLMAERALEIAAQPAPMRVRESISPKGAVTTIEEVDSAAVADRRLKFDALAWRAATLNRRVYGNAQDRRIEVEAADAPTRPALIIESAADALDRARTIDAEDAK